jgi:hypothetical protein
MKRLLFISFLIVPLLTFAQKQVILKNGQVINATVKEFIGKRLIFSSTIPSIDRNYVEISEVAQINGVMPDFRKNAIMKKNPWIVFNPEPTDQVATEPANSTVPDPGIPNMRYVLKKTPGGLIKKSASLRLTGYGIGVIASSLYMTNAFKKVDLDIRKGFLWGSCAVSLGFIIAGEVTLIKAGNKMIDNDIKLGLADNGIGVSVKF